MKVIHRAKNLVDAQLVRDVLIDFGISARITGEYLWGAVGELPPTDVIRVIVDEERFQDAQRALTEWHNSEPLDEPR